MAVEGLPDSVVRGPENIPALMVSRTAIATFQLPPGSQIVVTPERNPRPQKSLDLADLHDDLAGRAQPVDRTSFPGRAPVSSPFSKIGVPEQIVRS